MSARAEYVVLEYLEPTSPANRRVFEPVKGLGPVVLDLTLDEFDEYRARFDATGPFRVVPAAMARKCGLL